MRTIGYQTAEEPAFGSFVCYTHAFTAQLIVIFGTISFIAKVTPDWSRLFHCLLVAKFK